MTEICHASNAKDLRSAIIAACAMLLTFAAVAVPVPLYAEYKIALGLTDADIRRPWFPSHRRAHDVVHRRIAFDAFVAGRFVAAALLFGSLACALYIWLPNGAALQIARMVQGGIVRSHHERDLGFHADCTRNAIAPSAPPSGTGCLIGGMMIGSLGIGIYATFFSRLYPHVRRAHRADDAQRSPASAFVAGNGHAADHHPQGHQAARAYPENLRPVFPLAAGCYIAAWGTGVFFQSLSRPLRCRDVSQPPTC